MTFIGHIAISAQNITVNGRQYGKQKSAFYCHCGIWESEENGDPFRAVFGKATSILLTVGFLD